MRWREAKSRCRSPVEAGDSEVADNHDDGKIDRFEDADEFGAGEAGPDFSLRSPIRSVWRAVLLQGR